MEEFYQENEQIQKYIDFKDVKKRTDLDGNEPSLIMISSNRSDGKTTAVLLEMLNNFKESNKKRKVVLIYRNQYELSSSNMIFEDALYMYPEYGKEMTIKSHANGLFYELFLDGESFGFSVYMKKPDAMKKYSAVFGDCDTFLLDEFQLENGDYLPGEFEKFQSLLISLMRGRGKQSRNVKVYLLGNNVSLLNPYYVKYGVYKRIRKNTKCIRGHGWISYHHFNAYAAQQIKENPIFKDIAEDSKILTYSTSNSFLVDDYTFIKKPSGKQKYLFTILFDSKYYSCREYLEDGFIYVCKNYDPSYPLILSFQPSDHSNGTLMLRKNSFIWASIRDAYYGNYLRFDDMETKNVIISILAIDLLK